MNQPKSAQSISASHSTQRWFIVFLIAFIVVAVSQAIEALILPGEGRTPNLTIFFIKIVPLLLFVPGLYKRSPRSVVWVCFVILLYFMYAVTELMSPFGTWVHAVQLISVVTVFIAGIGFVRASSSDRKAFLGES